MTVFRIYSVDFLGETLCSLWLGVSLLFGNFASP
jgi:hypothetical protein